MHNDLFKIPQLNDDNNSDNSGSFIGEDFLKTIRTSAPFIVDGVLIGHPFNLQNLVNNFGKDIIPNCLGIYHLFYEDQLIYIGMSKNIRGRLIQHLRDQDMPFNYCLWFCAHLYKEDTTIAEILTIEYKMIKKFKPVLNSLHANCR
jgi:hypothetical protein